MSTEGSDCPNCAKLSRLVTEQKEKMRLIESRLKDLVRAYKSVCHERDALLANNTSQTAEFLAKQQHSRLSALEASVAEMSLVCGKYENQRSKDKDTIDSLVARCEQLEQELSKSRETAETSDQSWEKSDEEQLKRTRNRSVQTSAWEPDCLKCDQMKKSIVGRSVVTSDVTTQTETIDEENKNRKCELAIVMPTQRDEQKSDAVSDTSPPPSPAPSLDSSPTLVPSSSPANVRFPVVTSGRSRTSSESFFGGTSHSGVSLFYANELARKEIDLAESRLQAREFECALRELQWKYNVDKFKLQSRINELERLQAQIAALQPASQLNMTYIRNVLLRMLNTKDRQQRQIMINALLTALDANGKEAKEKQ